MTESLGNCWHCGQELGKHDLGRESLCLGCHKPTRVCRNCRWYAPGATNDCNEPMAERVMEKTQANFCELFEAKHQQASGNASDKLKNAADALFK
jgi:hypothetical protein